MLCLYFVFLPIFAIFYQKWLIRLKKVLFDFGMVIFVPVLLIFYSEKQ